VGSWRICRSSGEANARAEHGDEGTTHREHKAYTFYRGIAVATDFDPPRNKLACITFCDQRYRFLIRNQLLLLQRTANTYCALEDFSIALRTDN
jgi:hypothetical protein